MPDAPTATVEDMFVQTASGIRSDNGTMTLLGLTPHTIYFSDRPERIVGHITTHRFLQWWSEGDDSFAVDPPSKAPFRPPLGRVCCLSIRSDARSHQSRSPACAVGT